LSYVNKSVDELGADGNLPNQPDVLFLQEPYLQKEEKLSTLKPPKHFTPFYQKVQVAGNAVPYVAAVLVNDKYDGCNRRPIRIWDEENTCPGLIAGVTVKFKNNDIHFFSVYRRPGVRMEPVLSILRKTISRELAGNSRVVVGMDANAHHRTWNSHLEDDDGCELLNFIQENKLSVRNTWKKEYEKYGTSYIDVTFAGREIETKNWKFIDFGRDERGIKRSDHPGIQFEVKISEEEVVPLLSRDQKK
jgi:hypothetical protein